MYIQYITFYIHNVEYGLWDMESHSSNVLICMEKLNTCRETDCKKLYDQ